MVAWQRIDDGSTVTKLDFRSVVHKQFILSSGKIINAEIFDKEGSSATAVIAVTSDKNIVIARQFRCGPEQVMDEIPGGMIDDGETPEQATRRELLEETGYEAGAMEYVGKAYVNAWANSVHHYFIATDCVKVAEPTPEEFEEVEVKLITINQLIENARQARMTDVQGVFLAYDKLKEMETSI